MLTCERIAETRKASHNLPFDLSNTTVESIEKLIALNMQVIRTTVADTFDLAQKSLSLKEPLEWFAIQNSLAAPMVEQVHSYSRQVFDIVAATQAEFTRIGKAQCEAYDHQMQSVPEDALEAATTALNSAIAAASTLYEIAQINAQQPGQVTRTYLKRDFLLVTGPDDSILRWP
ncbi:phasin family protein [Paraburkholderia sp. LEh10]|uniref:TIGR01841 family phasin n=1 Tax=Paraburkholderia sp. LEh10 TaxID=2821353 RepID=UPI001AE3779B|nr:TIGR01841 family phasin [Paraburkholderia sp. LEh10]MBP0595252.1 phasin family protein [Paraburkholderia sp. LEh10]